jgi:Ni/Fe-hydrogenase 1 B-type cytochrome subunit
MMKKVYVWEAPVRVTHWINAIAIAALSVTGFYIGRPFISATSADQYIMGWMRFIHFVSAYVFVVSCAVRAYWAFAGNKYAGWSAFNIFSGKKLRELGEISRFYLFMKKEPPHTVGHSACATYVYAGLFILYIVEILSGFALYSQGHKPGVLWTLMGGWLFWIFESQTIRLYHHLVMWLLIAFAIGHVYIALFLESKEKTGVLGSIFSGYKAVDETYE